MALKRYQERVMHEVDTYLGLLEAAHGGGNRHASLDAWNLVKSGGLFALTGNYQERSNGIGKDLPTFCLKVPTGGGKTLLATQILGSIHKSILKQRNGAGLVLWVVPSDQIYKDTLKALRDRRHFYRESLEFAVSRRLEVWEKTDILNLTPSQLANNLNVLLLKLPSTNRQDRESLKFFRDSGGNIVMHFPPEDEPEKHSLLRQQFPNLETLEGAESIKPQRAQREGSALSASSAVSLLKTSLANLVRLCEPAVILDEGHKATSKLARETIEGFNLSIVVELSATPHKEANVLVRVKGQELLEEEMIKLPINVANSSVTSWKDCLTQARDKREALKDLAIKHYKATGRSIRPIVLVQVERTGKDQRDAGFVHSEDVKEYLIGKLNVPQEAIAIKSSERDDIEGIDLLAAGCPIEWIITKSALQEGWDCPFAYILVSLNNTASQQSMTQLVGRVLRQSDQTRTAFDALNESYVYCLRKTATQITKEVKMALEDEGYEGEAASVVDRSTGETKSATKRTTRWRDAFQEAFKPFEGKIYLPRFCVKNGRKEPEKLDYYRHLVSKVDVSSFDYASVDWHLGAELASAKDQFYRISLEQDGAERVEERMATFLENDEQVMSWLVANLAFDYFSHKQLHEVVQKVVRRLIKTNKELAGKLAFVKFTLREKITGFIERETDLATEAAFKALFDSKKLCFFLDCVECRFEIPESVEVRVMSQLQHPNGDLARQSLFDFVPDDYLNEYEKSVALFLDDHPQVLWWYRNLVGPENFSIQGFRRSPIYPDFLVHEGKNKKPIAAVLVVESKGGHLKGSPDTDYKRSVASYFGKTGHKVPWQKLGEEFENHQFRFQILDEGEYADKDWRDELRRLLENRDSQASPLSYPS